MKEQLFIFDKKDNLLTVTKNYITAPFKETVDQPVSLTIEFPVSDDDSEYLVGGNQVAFRDLKGNFRLFTIRETDDTNETTTEKIVECLPSFQELTDVFVEERRPQNQTAEYVLGLVLENSRWKVGNVADLGNNSTSFYFKDAYSCLTELIDIWGGEIVDRIEIDKNKIVGRYIDIVYSKGENNGKRFEVGKDIQSINRTVLYYPKTALYGQGSSLETDGGGHSRKLTFRDVMWFKEQGDPTDKPIGLRWVGDEEAREKHGIYNPDTNEMEHRFGLFEDNDEENPEELLKKTWLAVQDEKEPKAQYEMTINTFYGIADYEHEQVFLGDTGIARDLTIKPNIVVESRVLSWEYDIGNPREGDLVIGNILDLDPDSSDVDWVVDKVKDDSGNWDSGGGPITDDKFPDIKPDVPTNFEADGLFKVIMMTWDFNSSHIIAHYEVFGSQTKGFVPDETNLIFRGKVGGFSHQIDTDELWYYRLRAVNTHGTASDYTQEISASTVQLDLPDVEDIIPDFLEYQIHRSDKAPDPEDYKYWLDSSKEPYILKRWNEDTETWVRLSPTTPEDIGAVSLDDYQEEISGIISDLENKASVEWVDGKLVSKANKDDVYTIEELDNKFENVVSLTEYETDMEGIVTDLTDHETRIEQTEEDIQATVKRTEYEHDIETLETTLQENRSDIDINAEQIASKVSETQYKVDQDGIIESLESHTALIEQNADNISSKVEQTVFDSTKEELERNISNVEQTAEGIKSEVIEYVQNEVESEIVTIKENVSEIEQTTESIIQSVSSLETDHETFVDSTESTFEQHADMIESRVTANYVKAEIDKITPENRNLFAIDNLHNVVFAWITVENIDVGDAEDIYIKIHKPSELDGETTMVLNFFDENEEIINQIEWSKEEVENGVDESLSVPIEAINFNMAVLGVNELKHIASARIKVEKGTEPSVWTAAPEDIGDLSAQIVEVESIVRQHADEIELMVKENDVISSINQTAEQIKIDAERVSLGDGDLIVQNGKVYIRNGIITNDLIAQNAQIDGAKIADLSVDKLTGNVAEFVRSKWNSVTHSVQIDANGLFTFQGMDITSHLDGYGHEFYYDGYVVGEIGTSAIDKNPVFRGLTFNLENEAHYMAWTHLDSPNDSAYTVKLGWYSHGTNSMYEGFYINDKVEINGRTRIYGNTEIHGTVYVDRLSTQGYQEGNRSVVLQNAIWNDIHGVSFTRANNGGTLFLGPDIAVLKDSNNAYIEVGNDGKNYVLSVDVYNRTYSSTSQLMRVTQNGVFGRSTSSRRYKVAEEDISMDYAKRILELNAKKWFDKRAVEDYCHTIETGESTEVQRIERIGGIIAEDVYNAGLGMYVSYDDKDRPDGLHNSLWTLLIPITKDHDIRIENIENEHDSQIRANEKEIKALKKALDKEKLKTEKMKDRIVELERAG